MPALPTSRSLIRRAVGSSFTMTGMPVPPAKLRNADAVPVTGSSPRPTAIAAPPWRRVRTAARIHVADGAVPAGVVTVIAPWLRAPNDVVELRQGLVAGQAGQVYGASVNAGHDLAVVGSRDAEGERGGQEEGADGADCEAEGEANGIRDAVYRLASCPGRGLSARLEDAAPKRATARRGDGRGGRGRRLRRGAAKRLGQGRPGSRRGPQRRRVHGRRPDGRSRRDAGSGRPWEPLWARSWAPARARPTSPVHPRPRTAWLDLLAVACPRS